jgi:hypothetical protein
MLRRTSLVAAVAGMLVAAAWADEAQPLGVTLDYTWAGKYMAHGWNIGGDHPSHQPSVTVDALTPGLQFAWWGNFPIDRDRQNFDEYDWMLKYNRTLFKDQPYAVNLHGYIDYWTTPHSESESTGNALTGFKEHVGISFLDLIPIGSSHLVPSYNLYRWEDVGDHAFDGGECHEIFLAYGTPLKVALPGTRDQALNLGSSMNYHTGTFGQERGWSHATAHLSAPFSVLGITLSPSVNYQWSFEDTVDDENEFWGTLSVTKKF